MGKSESWTGGAKRVVVGSEGGWNRSEHCSRVENVEAVKGEGRSTGLERSSRDGGMSSPVGGPIA